MNARAEPVCAAEAPVAAADARTPVRIRSRFVTAAVLRIAGPPDAAFDAALDRLLRQAPHFFVDAPIVIDLEQAEGLETRADFQKLAHRLHAVRLAVIGVQNWSPEQKVAAAGAGLVALPKGEDRPVAERSARPAEPAAQPAAGPADRPAGSLLITEPVRSGQRIFAESGDLTVVAPVSSGAELIARGSIHVYGRLSGRALAGVEGDEAARIFCQSLEAELIAIAGLYKTSEDLGPTVRGRRVQAFLERDSLRIDPLR